VATIQRARRYLVELGYIERVRIGGGRVSTQWRIVVDKLAPPDAKPPEPAEAPERVNAPEKTTAQAPSLAAAELASTVLPRCHQNLRRTRWRRRNPQRRLAAVSAVSSSMSAAVELATPL